MTALSDQLHHHLYLRLQPLIRVQQTKLIYSYNEDFLKANHLEARAGSYPLTLRKSSIEVDDRSCDFDLTLIQSLYITEQYQL